MPPDTEETAPIDTDTRPPNKDYMLTMKYVSDKYAGRDDLLVEITMPQRLSATLPAGTAFGMIVFRSKALGRADRSPQRRIRDEIVEPT